MKRSSIYTHIVSSSILNLKNQNYATGLTIKQFKDVLSECFSNRGGFIKTLYLISQRTPEEQRTILSDISTDDMVRAGGPGVYLYLDWVRDPGRPWTADNVDLLSIALLKQQHANEPLPYEIKPQNAQKYDCSTDRNGMPSALWITLASLMYEDNYINDFHDRYLQQFRVDEDFPLIKSRYTGLICASIIHQKFFGGSLMLTSDKHLNAIKPYISFESIKETLSYLSTTREWLNTTTPAMLEKQRSLKMLISELATDLTPIEIKEIDLAMNLADSMDILVVNVFKALSQKLSGPMLDLNDIELCK